MSRNNIKTEVSEAIFENLDFLDEPTIIIPDSEEKKDEISDPKEPEDKEDILDTPDPIDEKDDNLDFLNEDLDEKEDKTPAKQTSELGGVVSKLIEEGVLLGFDDDKDFSEYTLEDFKELVQANISEKEKELVDKIPTDFYEALPQEAKAVAEYHAAGGRDWKSLFKALSEAEAGKSLDPTNESDAEKIIRDYYLAKNVMSEDEIEAEIADLKDSEKLLSKAGIFKPKLDQMQEELVAQKLEQQKAKQEKLKEQAKKYMDSVYKSLDTETLNGLPLDPKTQDLLFSGLVQPTYTNSQGNPTNLLGHLLEKYQFIEPDHARIAEALWLLKDPEGYKSKLKEQAQKEATEEINKKLKTEQQNTLRGTTSVPTTPSTTRRVIKKETGGGFFRRD